MRLDARPVAAHDQPLQRRHDGRSPAAPRPGRRAGSAAASARQRQDRRPAWSAPEAEQEHERRNQASAAAPRAGTRWPAGRRPAGPAGGRSRDSSNFSLAWRRGRKIAGEPSHDVPGSTGWRGGTDSTPSRLSWASRVSPGTRAALPTKPRTPTSVRPGRRSRGGCRAAPTHGQVGDEALRPQRQQVGVDVRDRRDLRPRADLGAQQPQPGQRVQRGVQRVGQRQAEAHQLVAPAISAGRTPTAAGRRRAGPSA